MAHELGTQDLSTQPPKCSQRPAAKLQDRNSITCDRRWDKTGATVREKMKSVEACDDSKSLHLTTQKTGQRHDLRNKKAGQIYIK
jgi:hypothetical protein